MIASPLPVIPQVFSMDIMRHKDSVDELVKTGKAIMDSKSPEEKEVLQVGRLKTEQYDVQPESRTSLRPERSYLCIFEIVYFSCILIQF